MRPAAPRSPLPIVLPAGAHDIEVGGPRPFVTDIAYTTADGQRVHWQSRPHRRETTDRRGLTWWIGLIFAIGSACFALGPLPPFVHLVGVQAANVTFFVGSIFFTTAAYLSYMQVVRDTGHRWFAWAPRHLGFWATAVQLVGTLYFNASTFWATMSPAGAAATDADVWRPDVLGSVCFLVSSVVAFAEAGHRWWSWRPGKRDWHITALNLWGSVFFGVSAVGAFVEPSGSMLSAPVANAGTFLGAVCFLAAAVLLMPEGRVAKPST